MSQEAVGGDLELERIAAPVPLGAEDVAHEDLVLRLRRRERPEVVLADEQIGGIRQALLVDTVWVVPGTLPLERRRFAAAPDAVAIRSRASGVARVKVRRRQLGFADGASRTAPSTVRNPGCAAQP